MERFFSKYSLVARVYPAILSLGPILWSALVLFPALTSNLGRGAATSLAIACGLYLLATLARSRGKAIEPKLIASWGGWPTTIVLRHRDSTIDPVTKVRYHKALLAIGLETPLPTPEQEAADLGGADHAYRSATKRLIELRRGREFQLIEDENASYGFRRNLLGLRGPSVVISALAAGITTLVWWARVPKPMTPEVLLGTVATYPYLPVLLVADLAYLAMFLTLIAPQFVRQAADEYALALFRTLEKNVEPKTRRRTTKSRSP